MVSKRGVGRPASQWIDDLFKADSRVHANRFQAKQLEFYVQHWTSYDVCYDDDDHG